jgi:hypothetical protein
MALSPWRCWRRFDRLGAPVAVDGDGANEAYVPHELIQFVLLHELEHLLAPVPPQDILLAL